MYTPFDAMAEHRDRVTRSLARYDRLTVAHGRPTKRRSRRNVAMRVKHALRVAVGHRQRTAAHV